MVLARHLQRYQRQRGYFVFGIQRLIVLFVFVEQRKQAAALVEGLQ